MLHDKKLFLKTIILIINNCSLFYFFYLLKDKFSLFYFYSYFMHKKTKSLYSPSLWTPLPAISPIKRPKFFTSSDPSFTLPPSSSSLLSEHLFILNMSKNELKFRKKTLKTFHKPPPPFPPSSTPLLLKLSTLEVVNFSTNKCIKELERRKKEGGGRMAVRELWGEKYGREMMRLSKLERGTWEEERGKIWRRTTRMNKEEEEEECVEGGWREEKGGRKEGGGRWEEEGERRNKREGWKEVGGGKKRGIRGGWEEGLVDRMYTEAGRLEKAKKKSNLMMKKCSSFHLGFSLERQGSEVSTFLTDSEFSKIKEEKEKDGGELMENEKGDKNEIENELVQGGKSKDDINETGKNLKTINREEEGGKVLTVPIQRGREEKRRRHEEGEGRKEEEGMVEREGKKKGFVWIQKGGKGMEERSGGKFEEMVKSDKKEMETNRTSYCRKKIRTKKEYANQVYNSLDKVIIDCKTKVEELQSMKMYRK